MKSMINQKLFNEESAKSLVRNLKSKQWYNSD